MINALRVDSLLRVHISKSSEFQDDNTNSPLTNANVEINQNNQKLGNMIHESNGWYSMNSDIPTANNSYQIEVSHPNLETAKYKTEVLEKVVILNLNDQIKEENKIYHSISG